MSDDGSGQQSRQAWQARMLRSRPGCRRLSEQDGSGRQEACHQRCLDSRQSRSPGDTSRWLNARRSRSFACRAMPCRRSLAGSAGRRRRSRGSCAATPPHEVAVWSIVRRRHSGTPSDPLVARSRRSSCATRRCAPMWRNDWRASSLLRAGLLSRTRSRPGKDDGMGHGRTGDGPRHGARSRSLAACRSTSRTMGRCVSATKLSIRRCSSKLEGLFAVS